MIDIGLLITTSGLSDSSYSELMNLLQNFEGNIEWEGEYTRTRPSEACLFFHPKRAVNVPYLKQKINKVINHIFFDWDYIVCGTGKKNGLLANNKEIFKKCYPEEFDLIQKDIIVIKEKIMRIEQFKNPWAHRVHEIGEDELIHDITGSII